MKKIVLALLVFASLNALSQFQMQSWSLAGRYMRFNPTGPSVLSPLPDVNACNGYNYLNNYTNCHNAMFNSSGNLMFFITDGSVYSANGDLIGELTDNYNNSISHFKGVDDYAIAPDPSCEGKYYIFFAGEIPGTNYVNSLPYYAHLNLYDNNNLYFCQGAGTLDNLGFGNAEPLSNIGGGGAYDMHAASVQFAVSKLTSTNERFVFTKSNLGFSRYRITSTGSLIYDNYAYTFISSVATAVVDGSSIARGETELVSLNGGGYRFACTFQDNAVGGNLFIADLNTAGTVISYTVKPTDDNPVSGYQRMPVGLEFSPNGEYLYFTNNTYTTIYPFTSFPINYWSHSNNAITNLPGPTLAVANTFSNSQIELGYDGRLHVVNSGTMSGFANPNAPAATNWIPNEFFFNFTYPQSDFSNVNLTMKKVYILPDQIDGETYNYTDLDAFNYTVSIGTSIWTDAINGNPFGHASPIDIRGVLTIPSGADVTIQSMDFRFISGSRIEIQNGGILRLDHTYLQKHPCSLMWDGITIQNGGKLYMGQYSANSTVQSRISHAVTGIHLTGLNSLLEVKDKSYFNGNERHIVIDNGNGSSIKIENSYLFHTLSLADQSYGMPSPSSTYNYGISSIEINNSGFNVPVLIGIAAATNSNTFRQGQYGIKIVNSNVKVIKNTFQNIWTCGTYIDETNVLNRGVNISNSNIYDNMPTGIYAVNKTVLNVGQNTFTNFPGGSQCVYFLNNSNTAIAITGNKFSTSQAFWYIRGVNNGGPSSNLSITNNTIIAVTPERGIEITENTLSASTSFSTFLIQSNKISGIGLGINILNIRGLPHNVLNSQPYSSLSMVRYNTISFISSSNEKTGIRAITSPSNSIVENTILSDNPGDWTNTGIYVETSKFMQVYKNTVSAGTGLSALGDMEGSDYYCNTFDGYVCGIKLTGHKLRTSPTTHGDATLGRQNYFSNQAPGAFELELWGCNNNENQWACYFGGGNSTFDVGYNGMAGPSNLVVITPATCIAHESCGSVASKLTNPTAVINENLPGVAFKITPNPSEGKFTCLSSLPINNCQVIIYDVFGKLIYEKHFAVFENLQIDISGYSQGIYYLHISNDQEIHEARKIIKE